MPCCPAETMASGTSPGSTVSQPDGSLGRREERSCSGMERGGRLLRPFTSRNRTNRRRCGLGEGFRLRLSPDGQGSCHGSDDQPQSSTRASPTGPANREVCLSRRRGQLGGVRERGVLVPGLASGVLLVGGAAGTTDTLLRSGSRNGQAGALAPANYNCYSGASLPTEDVVLRDAPTGPTLDLLSLESRRGPRVSGTRGRAIPVRVELRR